MKLEDIGFYTLSDYRARQTSVSSPLWRCELLVTNTCNFACPYCRHVGPEGHISWADAKFVFDYWTSERLKNVRLSGGEPTLWPHIVKAVKYLSDADVERIAISTNGSASIDLYDRLIDAGVNDFSISFDACCAEDCKSMTGGRDVWTKLTETIKHVASRVYTTVGVVLTDDNEDDICKIVKKAQDLGVSDIRVIPAAQHGKLLQYVPQSSMPILEYRRNNIVNGVRGLSDSDCNKCALVLDDMAVIGNEHYPCIIYAREGGRAIGKIGLQTRQERLNWYLTHDCQCDSICKDNCLDVCRDYNNTVEKYQLIDGEMLKEVLA